MGDQGDLWDFGTIRRDQRQATVSRAAPPPMPSIPSSSSTHHLPNTNNHGPQYQQQQQPRQTSPQKHSISRSTGSRFGSVTSSRSATPTSRGTPPSTNQFPAPPTSHPPPAPQPARSQPSSPIKQTTQPHPHPQSGNGTGTAGSGGSGYDTIRFAGDIAEQQARVEKGQWTDARGQEGGEYDSDDEEREREEEERDGLAYDDEDQEGRGEGERGQHEEDLDDSRAILEDVVVPVIESVSRGGSIWEGGREKETQRERTTHAFDPSLCFSLATHQISQRVPNNEAREVLANLRLAFEEAERM